MSKLICIIPARDEASRVKTVVEVALKSPLITGGVWVVDNCSKDDTAQVAKMAGANVLVCAKPGKGDAVAYAVKCLAAHNDTILMLDADLKGLRQDHLEKLIRPVITGECVQSGGVRDGWWWRKFYWR